MSEQKHGYANYKRAELLKILKPFLGKLKNISTGIEANLSKKSLEKMTSAKSLEKSKNNGFTLDEHFELATKIKPLYESAILVAAAILKNGKKADVLITVKESLANGHRIYSIELDEINKASERFEGLSDATVKTANRVTKTPHIDNLNLTHKSFDVNE